MKNQKYTLTISQEGNTWCARTPAGDKFRNSNLAVAIGDIFTRVNAAIPEIPFQWGSLSLEEVGSLVLQNADGKHPRCNVALKYS